MLPLLVGVVLAATLIQGLTSFTLTQTLSKAAQKLIAELRRRVQEHIGRLSVSYYDSNKTGTMVCAHHERRGGRAQPGGHRTGGPHRWSAHGGDCVRRADAHQHGDDDDRVRLPGGVRHRPAQGVQDDTTDLSRAVEDQCRGYGPADGIAGRRSGGEGLPRRRARAFGVQRGRGAVAAKRVQDADRDFADEPDVFQPDGSGGRHRDVHGHAADPGRQADAGRLLYLHDVPWDTWRRRCSRW